MWNNYNGIGKQFTFCGDEEKQKQAVFYVVMTTKPQQKSAKQTEIRR